eukprot:739420-Pelagomonas_calceolata.AAC.1
MHGAHQTGQHAMLREWLSHAGNWTLHKSATDCPGLNLVHGSFPGGKAILPWELLQVAASTWCAIQFHIPRIKAISPPRP